jgi:hypothetical protein
MEDENTTTLSIIEQLKKSKSSGLTFEQAKESLVANGFTTEQINIATDNFVYDAVDKPDIPENVEDYFKTHPEQAQDDANSMAKSARAEIVTDERNKAVEDMTLAAAEPFEDESELPDRIEHGHSFSSDIGISFWLFVFLIIGVNLAGLLIVLVLHMTAWLFIVEGVLTIALIVLLIKRIH